MNEEAKLHDISGSGEVRFMDEINHASQIALSGSGSIGEILIISGDKKYHDKNISYGFNLLNRAGIGLEAEMVKVESKNIMLLVSGEMDFLNNNLNLNGRLSLHDLDTLSRHINEKITGSGEIIFTLQRDNNIFSATVDADINRPSYKGAGADRVSFGFNGRFNDHKGDGRISAQGQRGETIQKYYVWSCSLDRDILLRRLTYPYGDQD